jgi:ABC-type transport system involved in multi-copper enzyme maturation permease subunit
MGSSLLHYRPWRGQLHDSVWSVWPVARVALGMMFRRKLFWILYAFGLLIFLMFFFGQYLLAFAQSQSGEQSLPLWGNVRVKTDDIIPLLRGALKLDGRPETYRNFFWWQGHMVMTVLALAGALVVGNDFRFGTLPFYLAKPLGRWHYLTGKCLAVAVFVNLLTTLPAVILFVQYGLLDSWQYFKDHGKLLAGIFGYGLLLSVTLSLLLVATATWLRRTVPLIMAWTTLFFFCRLLADALVDGLHYPVGWRLIDFWNDCYLVGNACLGIPLATIRPAPQPTLYQAALVLGAVCLLCLSYLNLRIRAVEIVR